jgi:hypothetical protein
MGTGRSGFQRRIWNGGRSRVREFAGGLRFGTDGFGMFGGRIFDFDEAAEDVGIDFPAVGLAFGALLGLQQEMADIGEGGGAAGRNTVGGQGLEELAEDVVDVDLGDEISGGAGKLFDEIVFAMEGAAMDGGVVEAEALVVWMGGHGAEFAVGEFKVAKVVGCVWSSVAHGEWLAKR